jgi:hypothetical protein
LNSTNCESSRHFRNKRREYTKHKISEFALNSKNKNSGDLWRGINEFKKKRHLKAALVKNEKGVPDTTKF